MSGKPEFFWSPPDGASIVGMIQYRDMIVVATSSGVYVIAEKGSYGLDHHLAHKISHDSRSPEFWKAKG